MKHRIYRRKSAEFEQGKYVLYWMQQAQRCRYNAALEYAEGIARKAKIPLLVVFILSDNIPDANLRHYNFMLRGLADVGKELNEHMHSFQIMFGNAEEIIPILARDALELVLDHGYLRYQRLWRETIYQNIPSNTNYTEIDTEAVVPVHLVSDKEEYSAATIRKKILKSLPEWLYSENSSLQVSNANKIENSVFPCYRGSYSDYSELWDWAKDKLYAQNIMPLATFQGAYSNAITLLDDFIGYKLMQYSKLRNHPELSYQSNLSPYLHFGQISPLDILQRICANTGIQLSKIGELISSKGAGSQLTESIASFAEELIVRRELSMNFCYHNQDYDNYMCIPNWARASLMNHLYDKRDNEYSLDRMEYAETDDKYWNAAQIEMIKTGKMHNYMRMYWGKRLLSWCRSPEESYQIMLYLNNKYELDGRDPNAYAGVAWCFGKHDRPWTERSIYGNVRYMNARGLERKFDMTAYIKKVEQQ